MNRIQLRSLVSDQAAHENTEIDFGVVTRAANYSGPHSLFAPLHYEPNYAYPLLIWLHGRGGNEGQLRRIMPLISMRNYVAAAPRGLSPVAGQQNAYDWGEAEVEVAAQRIFECLEAAQKKFHVAPQRVFLAGFESGGTLAFRVGMQHPNRFAGLLSVGGPFPAAGTPLASIRDARGLPLFIAHGRDAEQYPLDRICEELRLFHAAGLSVTLREYPCGDELTTQMLHDIDVWLMEQVTGVPSTSLDESSTSPFDAN
jgi:phospholipase/carboxylesterase